MPGHLVDAELAEGADARGRQVASRPRPSAPVVAHDGARTAAAPAEPGASARQCAVHGSSSRRAPPVEGDGEREPEVDDVAARRVVADEVRGARLASSSRVDELAQRGVEIERERGRAARARDRAP